MGLELVLLEKKEPLLNAPNLTTLLCSGIIQHSGYVNQGFTFGLRMDRISQVYTFVFYNVQIWIFCKFFTSRRVIILARDRPSQFRVSVA